jgi:molybdenum cofactor cytidylyltransferase
MITALILAAGESKRMGQPKMLMPWGTSTVFGTILDTLKIAGIIDLVVVTGSLHDEIKADRDARISFINNKDYSNGEMLTSIQVGLRSISVKQGASLIVLGDQPQMKATTVKMITDRYHYTRHPIIVPSYNMHRGHPWLVDHSFWDEILKLVPPESMRTFLNKNSAAIDYLLVDTPSVLQDIDTQEDYRKFQPKQA